MNTGERHVHLMAMAMAIAMAATFTAAGQGPGEILIREEGLDGSNGFIILDGRPPVSHAGDVNGDGLDDVILGSPSASETGTSYVVFGSREAFPGFPMALFLSNLRGNAGFAVEGINAGDSSGSAVSGAGDINGDGTDDFLIGAPDADPGGRDSAGETYVVFGNTQGFPSSFSLGDLNGSNGFVIHGINAGDRSGVSVSNAGDVNGDDFADVIIGAAGADPDGKTGAGESYVVFGTDKGFPSNLNLSSLNGSNGFRISGIDPEDASGGSVSTAGDVNGDGIADLVIGARRADPGGVLEAGESYVVFGSAQGFRAELRLGELDGSNGFTIAGVDEGDQSGNSVSKAGDVNHDGFDDIIVGARFAKIPIAGNEIFAGVVYVIFGGEGPFPAIFEAANLNGSNGFRVNGGPNDDTGASVSGLGDFNGDGVDDIVLGSPNVGNDPSLFRRKGQANIVPGSRQAFFPAFSIFFRPITISTRREIGLGQSVSAAGDFNGDGYGDAIVAGSGAFIVFGNDLVFGNGFERRQF